METEQTEMEKVEARIMIGLEKLDEELERSKRLLAEFNKLNARLTKSMGGRLNEI